MDKKGVTPSGFNSSLQNIGFSRCPVAARIHIERNRSDRLKAGCWGNG